MNLMATISWWRLSSADHTTPCPPEPISSSSWYCWKVEPGWRSVNSKGCTVEWWGDVENYLEAETGHPTSKMSWTVYPVPLGGCEKDIVRVAEAPLDIRRREGGPTKGWNSGKYVGEVLSIGFPIWAPLRSTVSSLWAIGWFQVMCREVIVIGTP